MTQFSTLDELRVRAWNFPLRRPALWKRSRSSTIPPTLGLALIAAPLCWFLQVAAARLAIAVSCSADSARFVRGAALAADATALVGALAGGVAAYASWRGLRNTELSRGGETVALGRQQFLAMWALMTSVWLFGAILFNALDSIPVRACGG